jgi:hypothetical protein
MILYHGSTVKVEKPLYNRCRQNTDFGKGFYTTLNREQAMKWAILKQQRAGSGKAVVTVFEVDDDLLERNHEFSILKFSVADKQWLEFVCNNRKEGVEPELYDIISGPVANDNLYATIELYEMGILSADAAIEQLKTNRLSGQISFNSQKAMNCLRFLSVEVIGSM